MDVLEKEVESLRELSESPVMLYMIDILYLEISFSRRNNFQKISNPLNLLSINSI